MSGNSTNNGVQIFTFKVAFKGRRSIWREIEIRGDQTLADFDQAIRVAFKHDTDDHLSEFYTGKRWDGSGLGIINPLGEGEGAEIKVSSLAQLTDLSYVYDFGSEVHHVIKLVKITDNYDPDAHYPRIVSQNKPGYQYCVECKAAGKTTIATVICISCSEEENKAIYLCEECAENKHDDHDVEDIVY